MSEPQTRTARLAHQALTLEVAYDPDNFYIRDEGSSEAGVIDGQPYALDAQESMGVWMGRMMHHLSSAAGLRAFSRCATNGRPPKPQTNRRPPKPR